MSKQSKANVVSPETMIRVQAIASGVFNGPDGDIHVCDPDSPYPLARFPRIPAKAARNGVMSGLISLNVDAKAYKASEKEGDRTLIEAEAMERKVAEADLKSLAALEASTGLGDKIVAHAPAALDPVNIGDAIVEDEDEDAGDEGDGKPAGGSLNPVVDKSKPWMEHAGGGVWNVGAPWLQEPIKVTKQGDKTGKELATAEVQRLIDEGDPGKQ